MKRKPSLGGVLGYVSLAGALAAWAVLLVALMSGGLDPRAAATPLLRSATTAAFVVSLLSLGLGILAVFLGDKGVPAALGVGGALLFLLMFSGIGWMFIR